MVEHMDITAEPCPPSSHLLRETLCIAGSIPGVATHAGEDDFSARLRKNYQADESNVAEQLVYFKQQLSKLDGEAFWTHLMEGMTNICHSQFAFVSKRILVDDHTTAVEMPAIGEEGSCLMAIALYYNNRNGIKNIHHDYKYYAWSCPCAYMKHDKVFLIADNLDKFIGKNPNQLPFEAESYLGVPLFAEGKCFAHFGMMWTKEGLARKAGLSWAFIELFMHSLEDMITRKLLTGKGFAKTAERLEEQASSIIPHGAVTATQSLKLYARSLSHELRTPMQGVVGMLDLMYATVQEQLEGQNNSKIRQIFQSLKGSIEVVQDSSKRAVEAADNVVQAYDLNMQVPDTPTQEKESPSIASGAGSYFDVKPSMTNGTQIVNPQKRKRSLDTSLATGHLNKIRNTGSSPRKERQVPSSPLRQHVETDEVSPRRKTPITSNSCTRPDSIALPPTGLFTPDADHTSSTPSFRSTNLREVLPVVINDSLRVGGRPDFAVSEPTTYGERIEVKTRSSNGEASSKIVNWAVEPDVPYMLPIDERDLSKLIGAVFLNSLKFTDFGKITIHCRLNSAKKYVIVRVSDTGMGIPLAFQPELFKAFSKEEVSITRTREGLGLGLMVAKGLARRIGGDLHLVRSSVDGPDHGSEFEIRFPLEACELKSRPATPFRPTGESSVPRSEPAKGSATPATTPPKSPPPYRILSPIRNFSTTPEPIAGSAKPLTTIENCATPRPSMNRRVSTTPRLNLKPDRQLGSKYPLTFLVAEDNKINRKLLVQMLNKLGYTNVHEAFDGQEAVRVVRHLMKDHSNGIRPARDSVVDVILMDLWMPNMDGYQATEQIFEMIRANDAYYGSQKGTGALPTVLAVSADVTDAAIDRATKIGMSGYMSKPFKVLDLQRLILEFCVKDLVSVGATAA